MSVFKGSKNNDTYKATLRMNYWKSHKIPWGFYDSGPARVPWLSSDDPTNYATKGNKAYGVKDIVYEINSFGYRSIEIDPTSITKKIMFLGCSMTAGIGLPHREVWTTVLTERLSNHFGTPIEQHNFGLPGHGADAMAMVGFQALPLIKPDILIMMYPDTARRTYHYNWADRLAFLPYFRPREWNEYFFDLHKAYIALSFDANDFYEWLRNHALIDHSARAAGSQYIWAFTSSSNIKGVDIGNLIEYVDISTFYPHIKFNLPGGDLARDGIHPGKISNQEVADKWFDAITQSAGLSKQLCFKEDK